MRPGQVSTMPLLQVGCVLSSTYLENPPTCHHGNFLVPVLPQLSWIRSSNLLM